jgi:hypothetical protein
VRARFDRIFGRVLARLHANKARLIADRAKMV